MAIKLGLRTVFQHHVYSLSNNYTRYLSSVNSDVSTFATDFVTIPRVYHYHYSMKDGQGFRHALAIGSDVIGPFFI